MTEYGVCCLQSCLGDALGAGALPGIRNAAGDHRGMEIVKSCSDDGGRNRAKGRGTRGEIAHPVAFQPKLVESLSSFGCKINDGVRWFENLPGSAGKRKIGLVDLSRHSEMVSSFSGSVNKRIKTLSNPLYLIPPLYPLASEPCADLA